MSCEFSDARGFPLAGIYIRAPRDIGERTEPEKNMEHRRMDVFPRAPSQTIERLRYPVKNFLEFKNEGRCNIFIQHLDQKYSKMYYYRLSWTEQYTNHMLNVGSESRQLNDFRPETMNWKQISKKLAQSPMKNQKNSDGRIGFKNGNRFLVKAFFTFGQRTVEKGTVHVVQTLNVPLVFYLMTNQTHGKIRNGMLPHDRMHMYDRRVLSQEGCFRIPPGTTYILASTQKNFFSLDVFPEDRRLPARLGPPVDPVALRMVKIPDFYDRQAQTPYIEDVVDEEKNRAVEDLFASIRPAEDFCFAKPAVPAEDFCFVKPAVPSFVESPYFSKPAGPSFVESPYFSKPAGPSFVESPYFSKPAESSFVQSTYFSNPAESSFVEPANVSVPVNSFENINFSFYDNVSAPANVSVPANSFETINLSFFDNGSVPANVSVPSDTANVSMPSDTANVSRFDNVSVPSDTASVSDNVSVPSDTASVSDNVSVPSDTASVSDNVFYLGPLDYLDSSSSSVEPSFDDFLMTPAGRRESVDRVLDEMQLSFEDARPTSAPCPDHGRPHADCILYFHRLYKEKRYPCPIEDGFERAAVEYGEEPMDLSLNHRVAM